MYTISYKDFREALFILTVAFSINIGLCSCKKQSPIVGSWTHISHDEGATSRYTFNFSEEGNGYARRARDEGGPIRKQDFSWSYDEGSKVISVFVDGKEHSEFKVLMLTSEKMVLAIDGEEALFNKEKIK